MRENVQGDHVSQSSQEARMRRAALRGLPDLRSKIQASIRIELSHRRMPQEAAERLSEDHRSALASRRTRIALGRVSRNRKHLPRCVTFLVKLDRFSLAAPDEFILPNRKNISYEGGMSSSCEKCICESIQFFFQWVQRNCTNHVCRDNVYDMY